MTPALRLHHPPDPSTETTAAPPPAALLDVDALAAMLSLGTSTIWRHHAAGRIPSPVRIGRAVRWRRDELAKWVEAGCPPRSVWERSKKGGER